MPIYRKRYANNWDEIAIAVKQAAQWRCRHCGQKCLRPGEKPKGLSRSEWTVMTLSVHHANFTPEDNRLENLVGRPIATPDLARQILGLQQSPQQQLVSVI